MQEPRQEDKPIAGQLVTHLRAQGYRLTRARKAILGILEQSKYPLSASELHVALQRAHVAADRVTIYRILTSLNTLGLVARLEFQEGQIRYEIRHGRAHHHHIRCQGCGRIVDVMLCPLKRLSALVARQTRFQVDSHALEFFGWCPKCQ